MHSKNTHDITRTHMRALQHPSDAPRLRAPRHGTSCRSVRMITLRMITFVWLAAIETYVHMYTCDYADM